MADKSGIAWLADSKGKPGATWQILAGCMARSPGCRECYSCRLLATRHRHLPWAQGLAEEITRDRILTSEGRNSARIRKVTETLGYRWTGKVTLRPDQLDWPMHHPSAKRIFVADRSDLFHEAVPSEYRAAAFGVMAACPDQQFLVLTKRVDNALEWFEWHRQMTVVDGEPWIPIMREAVCYLPPRDSEQLTEEGIARDGVPTREPWPLPNVAIGASVCVAAEKSKIDQLRQVPAALRFLSLEPCLEDLGELDLTGIDWVICGGESGPKARPLHPQWVRSVRDQCVAQGVRFFFKQWGQWLPIDQPWQQDSPKKLERPDEQWLNLAGGQGFHGDDIWRVRKMGAKRAGYELDGRVWREFPKAWSKPA